MSRPKLLFHNSLEQGGLFKKSCGKLSHVYNSLQDYEGELLS